MATHTETVAFFGASGGVGLAALRYTLSTGCNCIVLCRTPSKLAAILPPLDHPNLRIVQGNAHDIAAVSNCLQAREGAFVDKVVTTIGGAFVPSKMSIDDPEVCRKGMSVLLEAINQLRKLNSFEGRPHIICFSTTGISKFGRDIPVAMIPLYHVMLKVPHEDKVIMEDNLIASGEEFAIVRASLMIADEETNRKVRVGIEDPRMGRESAAIGYTITKGDAGRWLAENLIIKEEARYRNKISSKYTRPSIFQTSNVS